MFVTKVMIDIKQAVESLSFCRVVCVDIFEMSNTGNDDET